MDARTLAQRLAEGKLPPAEALRYAMLLAEALRKSHDGGRAHGAVCPANILLAGAGIELSSTAQPEEAIPYAAPEVLAGNPADARSDLFSFGAIVYEMLAGRQAFEGADRTAPVSTGSPAVDRLMANCMAPNAAARPQRMQKVMLELKLLLVTAQRAAAPAATRATEEFSAALRNEMQQLETRLASRFQSYEKILAEVQTLAGEAARGGEAQSTLRFEMQQLDARVGARLQAGERAMTEMQRIAMEALNRNADNDSSMRTELVQLEARLTARLQAQEKTAADMQRGSSDALIEFRGELRQMEDRLAARIAAQEAAVAENQSSAAGALNGLRSELEQMEGRLAARIAAQEAGLAESHESAAGALNGLRGELEQMEGRLAGRIAAQESALAETYGSVTQSVQGIHGELEQLESRLAARIAAQESALAETQGSAAEAIHELRAQFAEIAERLAAQERAGAENSREALTEHVLGRVHESVDEVSQRIAHLESQGVGGDAARVEQVESTLEGVRGQVKELRDLVAEDLLAFEEKLKTQTSAIDSARTAIAQTDDLVERVVEALESLQSAVLEQTDERALAVN